MIAEPLRPLAVPITELRLLDGNPRRGDVAAVKRSLRRFGQRKPVVIRDDGTVEAGNTTLKAALELGWTELAAVPFSDDDATAKAFALADNRTSELGSFDAAALLAMAVEVDAADPELLLAASYDLKALLPPTGKTDPDAVPEPPAEPVTRPGDLWELGRHRLLCGDATVVTDVERLMAGETACLMATDPPYLVDYDGGAHPASNTNRRSDGTVGEKHWDAYIDPDHAAEFFHEFIAAARAAALTDAAVVYQWHADKRRGLVLAAWETTGLLPHQAIVWVKSRPVLTFSHFMIQHEPALYGWFRGSVPSTDRRPPANETTVWEIGQSGASNNLHPTEKPVEIFARPIRWHAKPGELCYEPFSGSGSQIIAAHREGRRCYAMELSPQFVDVACRRYQEHTGTKPVLSATGEPHDFT